MSDVPDEREDELIEENDELKRDLRRALTLLDKLVDDNYTRIQKSKASLEALKLLTERGRSWIEFP